MNGDANFSDAAVVLAKAQAVPDRVGAWIYRRL
jgi:hypothetical protein